KRKVLRTWRSRCSCLSWWVCSIWSYLFWKSLTMSCGFFSTDFSPLVLEEAPPARCRGSGGTDDLRGSVGAGTVEQRTQLGELHATALGAVRIALGEGLAVLHELQVDRFLGIVDPDPATGDQAGLVEVLETVLQSEVDAIVLVVADRIGERGEPAVDLDQGGEAVGLVEQDGLGAAANALDGVGMVAHALHAHRGRTVLVLAEAAGGALGF